MSSCEPTYPARALTQQLPVLIKNELGYKSSAFLVGKTLWIFFPSDDLIDQKKLTWNPDGLEAIGKVMSVVHRVVLSTDAKLNFAITIGADTKYYGVEFVSIDYIPDLTEAVLERFSRGEYFLRSVRDIRYDTGDMKDPTGASHRYYDMPFDEFISLQIIHRVKSLFARDKTLSLIYEIKSATWDQRFGVLKIDVEFLKKRYDLSPKEEKVRPIDYLTMVAAKVFGIYNYCEKSQGVELTDTFTGHKVRLTCPDLKKVKIDLPELTD